MTVTTERWEKRTIRISRGVGVLRVFMVIGVRTEQEAKSAVLQECSKDHQASETRMIELKTALAVDLLNGYYEVGVVYGDCDLVATITFDGPMSRSVHWELINAPEEIRLEQQI